MVKTLIYSTVSINRQDLPLMAQYTWASKVRTYGGSMRWSNMSVFCFSSISSAVLCSTMLSRLSAYFSSFCSMLSIMSNFLQRIDRKLFLFGRWNFKHLRWYSEMQISQTVTSNLLATVAQPRSAKWENLFSFFSTFLLLVFLMR